MKNQTFIVYNKDSGDYIATTQSSTYQQAVKDAMQTWGSVNVFPKLTYDTDQPTDLDIMQVNTLISSIRRRKYQVLIDRLGERSRTLVELEEISQECYAQWIECHQQHMQSSMDIAHALYHAADRYLDSIRRPVADCYRWIECEDEIVNATKQDVQSIDGQPTNYDSSANSQLYSRLIKVVCGLPSRHKKILKLKLQGHSVRSIATNMGTSKSTVQRNIDRLRNVVVSQMPELEVLLRCEE